MANARAQLSSEHSELKERNPCRRDPHVQGPTFIAHGPALDGIGNRALLSLLRSGQLQRKARVSLPADPREHAADRAADAVIAGARPAHGPRDDDDAVDVQRMPTEDEKLANALGLGAKDDALAIPTSSEESAAPGADVVGQLSGGRSLDWQTREVMESRFGESFADVRIHTDHRAGATADTLHSRAFTVGEDIVFAEGEFAPETTEGRRLLAHELAHVVQQRQQTGPVGGEKETERDAREAAHEVVGSGTPAVHERAAPGTVQMQPKEEWGFSRPTSRVAGLTVLVNDRPMAAMYGGEHMTKEGSSWDSSTRTLGVVVSVTGRFMEWTKISTAEADARRDNLFVVLTARGFGTRTRDRMKTITIGARRPGKKPSPPGPVGEPTEEPKAAEEPKVEEPAETKAPSGDRVKKVERQSENDPKGAVKEAGELSHSELTSLGPEPRKALLGAAADASPGSTAPHLAHDLITTTPDRDGGAVSDALQADGGKLLNDLKRNEPDPEGVAALDDAARDLEARRQDAPPPQGERDFVDWTPELQKKANEVREAMKKLGRRTPSLNENMEGRPEWGGFKQKQEDDLQRELRNLERDVARWNAEHVGKLQGDTAGAIGTAARDEVGKALERVRTAKTITELFEARKQANEALWRANQMMDAKNALDRFESGVKAWNEAQGGWAKLASRPSHVLANVSWDRPDQIAAEARAEVDRALGLLRDAKTREEMSRAATLAKQAIANAGYALDMHKEQVYGGAEDVKVGIGAIAITSAAIVAPEYVIPGFIFGGGLSAARQGVQIAEGSPKEFSGREVFWGGVGGGFAAPLAAGSTVVVYGLTGWGLYNAAGEFSEGHVLTGTFDLATAALPLAMKGASGKSPGFPGGRWVRTRAGALMLRTSLGIEDVPGLGGRNPTVSIPYEPRVTLVAIEEPTVTLRGPGGVTPEALPPEPPLPGSRPIPQAPSVWQTVRVDAQLQRPSDLPIVLAVAGVGTHVPASTSPPRAGTQTATTATARFADIAEYRRQLRAIRAGGVRLSEHEHVRAYINDYLMMMDPATGVSAFDRAAYRRMATVTIPRDMALIKTRADLALRDRIRAARASGVLNPGLAAELSPEAAVARTIAARDAAIAARPAGQPVDDLHAITDDVIRRTTHYQFGQLFESGDEAARAFIREAEAFPSDEAFDEAFRERTQP